MSKKKIASKVWKKIFPQDLGKVILLDEWERHGYHCKITQGKPPLDHCCGYVGISRDHPFVKHKNWDAIDRLEVHGGVTLSKDSKQRDESWETKLWELPYYWIGFDCAHGSDYSRFNQQGHKWTLSELIQEVNQLADQLWKEERKENV